MRVLQLDAVFADDDEHGHQPGGAKQLANLLAQVYHFQLAAGGPSRYVQADQGTQTHAIHTGEIGKIQNNSLRTWYAVL